MVIVPNLRPQVVAAKERLAHEREKLSEHHRSGTPGIQTCARLTDLVDSVLLELYQAALVDLGETGEQGLENFISLVAHGGYGRGDVAPYSDVDFMILHQPGVEERVQPLAKRMLNDLFDAGLSLSQSVRTPTYACQLAIKDPTIATSLMESRHLAGSERLFRSFTHSFQRRIHRKRQRILAAIDQARDEERLEYGETVYLLEPNLKRSPGGLRDIHDLRWTGFA